MKFEEMKNVIIELKNQYHKLNKKRGEKKWDLSCYTQGFVGDVGDLSKLIMAKMGYRTIENIDEKITQELIDCLFSIICIAYELNIDIEKNFDKITKKLKNRIKEKDGKYKEKI